MMKFNVFVTALCYGEEHVDGMLEVANQFVKKNFPHGKLKFIVVNNKLQEEGVTHKYGGVYIKGDNSQHEFSGWQSGIEFINKNLYPSNRDVVVFVNDTVHRRSYTLGGDRYFDNYLIGEKNETFPDLWAAGYLDDFPAEVSIKGHRFSTWIRSNLFAINWAALQLVLPLVFTQDKNEVLFGSEKEGFWSANAPMSDNWIAYISCWLFGEEDSRFPEYRLKWIRAQKINEKNRDYFKQKAISILSEHYLTARLLSSGVKIYDFNTYPKKSDRHLIPYYK